MSANVSPAPLAPAETSRLAELEGVIKRGLTTFVEVGRALSEVRDSRLYRERFDTFESYSLLTAGEVAELLAVPQSWVREQ